MTDNTKGQSNPGGLREAEEQIRQRLLAMERENASLRARVRWLGLGVLATLLLGALATFGPGLPGFQGRSPTLEVLTAQRIVITDAAGVPRGEWRVDEEGDARIGLFDRQGGTRLSMAVLSGGSPGLSLINRNGQRRAALALLPDESTNLTFADGTGQPRVILGRTAENTAQLVFADGTGLPRIALGMDEDGAGNVILPPDTGSEPEGQPGG